MAAKTPHGSFTNHFRSKKARPHDEAGAADFVAFLLAAWHGAFLRMKVERNATALERFRRMLATLLAQPGKP
jgi:AcrR family transcriptional regulator